MIWRAILWKREQNYIKNMSIAAVLIILSIMTIITATADVTLTRTLAVPATTTAADAAVTTARKTAG